jgi:hypothetical protein
MIEIISVLNLTTISHYGCLSVNGSIISSISTLQNTRIFHFPCMLITSMMFALSWVKIV